MATYAERKDAQTVSDKLAEDDVEARIHIIECNNKKIGVANDKQKRALETGLKKYLSGIEKLKQASLLIEDEAKMNQQAKAAVQEISAVKTEINKGMASGENDFADSIYQLAENVRTELAAETLSAKDVQHAYAKACYEYIQLANKL